MCSVYSLVYLSSGVRILRLPRGCPAGVRHLMKWEFPRLCRGGTWSLPVPEVCFSSYAKLSFRCEVCSCWFWLCRLRSGPFEGPATVKPPVLPEDSYSRFSKHRGQVRSPCDHKTRHTQRRLHRERIPFRLARRLQLRLREPTQKTLLGGVGLAEFLQCRLEYWLMFLAGCLITQVDQQADRLVVFVRLPFLDVRCNLIPSRFSALLQLVQIPSAVCLGFCFLPLCFRRSLCVW